MQVTIYLGSRCNLSCPYCHRERAENEVGITDEFINQLKSERIDTIKFMGGEPTLYMDDIRKVVYAMPEKKFIVCTNGVSLKENIDFFREYEFLVCISYDGDNDNIRGYDPFQDLLDYPRLSVSTTIYHGNTDFKKILKKFAEKERIIGRGLSFFPHFAHATGDSNDGYALTMEDAESIIRQYKEMVGKYMRDYYSRGVRNIRYEGMFTGLKRRYEANFEYGETYCVNKGIMKCDTSGRAFTCLYIRDQELKQYKTEQQALLDEQFPECKNCPVYFMCGGGCVKSRSRDVECYINKIIFSWFKTEYERLRGASNADR